MEKIANFNSKNMIELLYFLFTEDKQIFCMTRSKNYALIKGKLNFCKWNTAALQELDLVQVNKNTKEIQLTQSGNDLISSLKINKVKKFVSNNKQKKATKKNSEQAWSIILESKKAKTLLENNFSKTLFYKTVLGIKEITPRNIAEYKDEIWESSQLKRKKIKPEHKRSTSLSTADNRLPGWIALYSKLSTKKENHIIDSVALTNHIVMGIVDESEGPYERKDIKKPRKTQTTSQKLKKQEQAIKTGYSAEEVVFNYEIQRLKKSNQASFVVWASKDQSDDLGYDIETLSESGEKITLEVKYVESLAKPVFKLTNKQRKVLKKIPGALVILVDSQKQMRGLNFDQIKVAESRGQFICNEVEYHIKLK